jgi:putative component of toxin-antitoxin plasmid stabilization module
MSVEYDFLPCGGDIGTQEKDIGTAKRLAEEWRKTSA